MRRDSSRMEDAIASRSPPSGASSCCSRCAPATIPVRGVRRSWESVDRMCPRIFSPSMRRSASRAMSTKWMRSRERATSEAQVSSSSWSSGCESGSASPRKPRTLRGARKGRQTAEFGARAGSPVPVTKDGICPKSSSMRAEANSSTWASERAPESSRARMAVLWARCCPRWADSASCRSRAARCPTSRATPSSNASDSNCGPETRKEWVGGRKNQS